MLGSFLFFVLPKNSRHEVVINNYMMLKVMKVSRQNVRLIMLLCLKFQQTRFSVHAHRAFLER